MRRTCPRCRLINPESAVRCECGYELGSVHFTEAAVKAIDLSWADTFMLCLKVGLCAIPAIWIAWFAWNLPGFIFHGAAAIKAGAEIRELRDGSKKAKDDADKALRDNPLG